MGMLTQAKEDAAACTKDGIGIILLREEEIMRQRNPQSAVRVGTIERSPNPPTTIPTTVHEGGVLSLLFSKKAREKYFGQRVSGRDRQADLEKLTKTQRLVYS